MTYSGLNKKVLQITLHTEVSIFGGDKQLALQDRQQTRKIFINDIFTIHLIMYIIYQKSL